MNFFGRDGRQLNELLANQLTILENQATLIGKVNQLSTSNTALAAQLTAVATQLQTQETQIETDLAALSTNQSTALADFKLWLAANGNTINPADLTMLQGVAGKLTTVDATLQTLATAAKTADPGAAPAAPVNA